MRNMFLYAKLQEIFWGKAVYIAIDIIKLSPPYTLEMDVREHVWIEKDANYKHVKVLDV